MYSHTRERPTSVTLSTSHISACFFKVKDYQLTTRAILFLKSLCTQVRLLSSTEMLLSKDMFSTLNPLNQYLYMSNLGNKKRCVSLLRILSYSCANISNAGFEVLSLQISLFLSPHFSLCLSFCDFVRLFFFSYCVPSV